MKKLLCLGILLCTILSGFAIIAAATSTTATQTKAVIRSLSQEERVAVYYEPSETSRLKGEYFNGVSVNILEHVSDEWVRVDITTFGDGGYGCIRLGDLAFGNEGEQVESNIIMYESVSDFIILNTHPNGPSGDIGPFGRGEQVELLGFVVSDSKTGDSGLAIKRPLVFEQCNLHVKIGDTTGFLIVYDMEGLREIDIKRKAE